MALRTLLAAAILGLLPTWAKSQEFNRHYDAYGAHFAQGSYGIENRTGGWMGFSFSYEPDTITPDSILGIYVIVLQRLDYDGNVTLEKRIQYPGHSIFLGWADCCDSVGGGGYVIGGSSKSYSDVDEARIVRLNPDGDTLWTRSYGSVGHYWIGQQVTQTNDGGFLICGATDAVSFQDGFAIKTDSLGQEQWRHTYGLSGTAAEGLSASVELSNGYLLSGISWPQEDNSEMYVVRVDLLGNEIWSERWGGAFDDGGPHCSLNSAGQVVLATGYGYAPDGNLLVPYLAQLDTSSGQLLWEHQYGQPYYSTLLFAAKSYPNDEIIGCGVSYVGDGNEKGLLLRTTSNGDSLWMRTYFYYDSIVAQGQGRFWDVLPTADNGCIASGFAGPPFSPPLPPNWSQDTWVVKVDSMGCVVPGCNGVVGITEVATNLGDALHLYPNPVRDQLHVGISLPKHFKTTGPLTLTVTSLAGQLVLQRRVPFSPSPWEKGPGNEGDEVVLDVSGLAAGVFSIHLSDATTWIAGEKFVVE